MRTLGGAVTCLPQVRFFATGDIFEMTVPDLGAESITEGTIMEWKLAKGDPVNKGDVITVIETDKVTVEVNAPESGTIEELLVEEGAVCEVGKPLLKIKLGPGGSAPAKAPEAAPAAAAAPAASAPPSSMLAQGLEAAHAEREGKPAAAPAAAPKAAPKAAPAAPAPSISVPGSREERRVKMTRMRARIATRLKDAQNTAAMLTTFQEVDMGPVMEMRSKYKDAFEKAHGCKLGFMSIFCKAAACALTELPAVNAVIDDTTNEIVYRDYADISVAVASPRGLVVPVIKNVESMSFLEIEQSIAHFAAKAKADALTLDEMTGGTFTISNGGIFGSMMGTPIINPPQSAILGMHATKMRPAVVDGQIVARPIMYLALTYDHRIVDGREAVTFLVSIRDKVEDPRRLLLDL
jgi:2-oxoglutarate dehydrogenase E2 component (dihydrolipoamide succinyltransferase)